MKSRAKTRLITNLTPASTRHPEIKRTSGKHKLKRWGAAVNPLPTESFNIAQLDWQK